MLMNMDALGTIRCAVYIERPEHIECLLYAYDHGWLINLIDEQICITS